MLSLIASSSIKRKIDKAIDSLERIVPWPLQRGHGPWLASPSEGRKRWRDISSKPKREILPICTRARSGRAASFKRFSTSR